jgi:hypothetical protein
MYDIPDVYYGLFDNQVQSGRIISSRLASSRPSAAAQERWRRETLEDHQPLVPPLNFNCSGMSMGTCRKFGKEIAVWACLTPHQPKQLVIGLLSFHED